eukprot:Gb_30271 [translate_table: standard]
MTYPQFTPVPNNTDATGVFKDREWRWHFTRGESYRFWSLDQCSSGHLKSVMPVIYPHFLPQMRGGLNERESKGFGRMAKGKKRQIQKLRMDGWKSVRSRMDKGVGQEGGIEMPISTVKYGHIHESSKPKMISGEDGSTSTEEIRTGDRPSVKKSVRYRECLKNHAVGLGGYAVDGCGEFMPSGDEGTLEALKCAACDCHRNFHRREVDGESHYYHCYNPREDNVNTKIPALSPPAPLALPSTCSPCNATVPRCQAGMIMAFSDCSNPGHMGSGVEQDYMGTFGRPSLGISGMSLQPLTIKKRFRTKFTQNQKDKMYDFAEKLGWRIQKQDEALVQQFCMDLGVKRHVLKVWMHNNKHSFAKKM